MPHELDPGFNATERQAIALLKQGATPDHIAAVLGLSPSALETLFEGINNKWPLDADPGSRTVNLRLDADTDHPHVEDMDAVGLLAHLRSMHGLDRLAVKTFRKPIEATSAEFGLSEVANLHDVHRSLHRAPPPSIA